MTQQPTLNRQDQPMIQIGPRHGYRIDGDHAFINAELQVPPYHSGGEWTLELWATEQPYGSGPLTGLKIAQSVVELPTPIGQHVHQVDARTAARLPPQGRAYSMVLALVQHDQDGQTNVHAFANYAQPQTFNAPHFVGDVGYRVQGPEVVLQADGIFNPRGDDNLSGTLSLELWAFSAEAGTSTEGLRLAACDVERVSGQFQLAAIERRVAFSEPPVGRFRLALLLCEWTLAHGYVARDRRDFGYIYERPAPEVSGSSPARVPVAPAAPVRAVDKLRLVPTPTLTPTPQPTPTATTTPQPTQTPTRSEASSPAVAVPSAPPSREGPPSEAPALVSIQTGSVEELARVKGLNLKIAKEIIKARPFASLADLIRVRGLGVKTISRLKGLLTL